MPYSPKWQTKTVETCLLFILDRLEYTESLGNYIPIEVFAKLHILIDEIRENGADSVKVLDVFGGDMGHSIHDNRFVYRKGETVTADGWTENRFEECGHGIHFFITRKEAEEYE